MNITLYWHNTRAAKAVLLCCCSHRAHASAERKLLWLADCLGSPAPTYDWIFSSFKSATAEQQHHDICNVLRWWWSLQDNFINDFILHFISVFNINRNSIKTRDNMSNIQIKKCTTETKQYVKMKILNSSTIPSNACFTLLPQSLTLFTISLPFLVLYSHLYD